GADQLVLQFVEGPNQLLFGRFLAVPGKFGFHRAGFIAVGHTSPKKTSRRPPWFDGRSVFSAPPTVQLTLALRQGGFHCCLKCRPSQERISAFRKAGPHE